MFLFQSPVVLHHFHRGSIHSKGLTCRYNRKDKYVDFVGEYHLDLIQDGDKLRFDIL